MSQKKIRILGEAPIDWGARNGPAIGECNDLYFLKDEPWLEFRRSTLKECKQDGVIPWIRSGCRGALLEAETLGLQILIGPNCVFADSNQPLKNDVELRSPSVYKLLMSDEVNADLARSLCKYDKSKIQQVPYFMRPELYDRPFRYKKIWDCYYHVKTSINRFSIEHFKKITATHHGWYNYFELQFKAEHSEICIHGCDYDNYGLAIHEISMLGCPIVYDNRGFKRGSIGEGMGIEVSNIGSNTPEDSKEIIRAAEEAKAMDRRKVWEASRIYQSVDNLLKRYRKAIF